MLWFRATLCSTALLALAGCGFGGGEAKSKDAAPEVHASTSQAAAQTSERAAHGKIGPVEFAYDDEQLTRADIQLTLPPDYEQEVYATKLIPSERADHLGEESCSYGESGLTETCTASKEPGVALGLLARPLSDYRAAFADSGIGEEELERIEVDETEGFAFTAQAEGSGTEYCFVPVGERTLLLARTFRAGAAMSGEAIRNVLASISLGG